MGFLESIIESLKLNSTAQNSIDQFRLKEVFRILFTSQTISPKKETRDSVKDEFAAITTVSEYGGLEISSDMSKEEIELTQRCIAIRNELNGKGLSEEKKNEKLKELRATYKALRDVRKIYDRSGRYLTETAKRATEIVKNVKTYGYIEDEKKNKSLFKKKYYGMDDPFYEGLKEIYGEDGLNGYRKERIEAFKNISETDMKWASKRYKRINTALTTIKSIMQIGVFLGTWKAVPFLAAERISSDNICSYHSDSSRHDFKNTGIVKSSI